MRAESGRESTPSSPGRNSSRVLLWGVILILPVLFIALAAWSGEGSVIEVAARLAFRPLCHQYADRCYELAGSTMVVCARCAGFYLALGLIGLGASLAARFGLRWRTSTLLFLLVVPLLVDGAANLFNIWDTGAILRSLTGVAAAAPLALLLIGSRDGTF